MFTVFVRQTYYLQCHAVIRFVLNGAVYVVFLAFFVIYKRCMYIVYYIVFVF